MFVHTYQQHASNYGSRVFVDTAPGPVLVYRAFKRLLLIPAHSDVHHRAGTAPAAPPRNPQSLNHGHLSCTEASTTRKHTATAESLWSSEQARPTKGKSTTCTTTGKIRWSAERQTMGIGLCTTTRMMTTSLKLQKIRDFLGTVTAINRSPRKYHVLLHLAA